MIKENVANARVNGLLGTVSTDIPPGVCNVIVLVPGKRPHGDAVCHDFSRAAMDFHLVLSYI